MSSLFPFLPAGEARGKFGDSDMLNKHSSLQLDECDIGHGFSRSFRKSLTKCHVEPYFPTLSPVTEAMSYLCRIY